MMGRGLWMRGRGLWMMWERALDSRCGEKDGGGPVSGPASCRERLSEEIGCLKRSNPPQIHFLMVTSAGIW